MANVGDRIREIRQVLDMNQRELAEALNTRQATISAWERGEMNISPGNLRLLADLCRDSRAVYQWLLGESPSRPRLRPYAEGESEGRSSAETHGFQDESHDVSDLIRQLDMILERAELSLAMNDELMRTLQDRAEATDSRALDIARQGAELAQEQGMAAVSSGRLTRSILVEVHSSD